MKILIIEDDKNLANLVSEELNNWGYKTAIIKDFNNIINEFNNFEPHLVLIDIMLPYHNGYYWCQKIREISNVPIIFISSKSEDINIIQAMQYGADDYIVKPININITIAKIQALLRREYDFSTSINYLEFYSVKLNLSDNSIQYQNKSKELTKTEFLILEVLFRQNGNIATRDSIMDRCWQGDNYIDENTLAVNMTRLRKKLSKIGLNDFIITRKGQGYQLSSDNL